MSTSVFYGAQGAVAAPPSAAPAEKPKKATATSAADIASARVAARLNKKRVEALSERTETSTTWANPDGSLTTELSAGPIRFRKGDEWKPVDLDLVRASDGSVAPKAHPQGLELGKRGGKKLSALSENDRAAARDLVTLGEGDERITLQWKGGLPEPELDGTRATYPDALPGADVVVEATRTGFEQFVEIKRRPAEGYSYTLPLKAKGLTAKRQPDGSVLFTDRKNKKRAVMPAPIMWDASVDKVSGEHTRRVPVAMKVVQRKGGIDLVVTPDAGFLADPETTYPVTVDPSTSALSNVFDTYIQQGETRDWSTDKELDFGNPGTKNPDGTPRTAQSFISWNTSPIADALVSSAKLSLWNFHSGNDNDCKAQSWEVWSTGAASTASRWTAPPAWIAKKATSTETKGNSDCASADGWINADVTSLAQEWAAAKATRGHMGLRATSESVTAQWKRVNSANAASNPPKLVVTYNYRPRTGTKQEAGPPYLSYSGSYVVDTSTPTLRDTFVDPDGDKVTGSFQIYDAAANTQVGDVLVSKAVPSGQPASVTVPAGVLAEGKSYKFRTSPYDGTHYNTGWSAWKTFTIDTKAPSAPSKIASTDYPSDKWVKGAGQAGTFTVTPPGSDHHWLESTLDGVNWTKVATNGASADKAITVTPQEDGTHTLQVRSVDKADNKSEALEYVFHVGPGGFVQPSDGQRTARRLPLVAEAEAGKYDGVSFSWRRSASDTWQKIPPADVTAGDSALSAWPVPLTDGKNAPLSWNAAKTVDPDGSIQIKADFTGPDGAASSTEPLTAVVDRNAEGASTADLGPGQLNLLTGDFKVSGTEEAFFGLTASRTASSRQPAAGGSQEGQAPIFGKEWVSGTVAEVAQTGYTHIRKTSGTSLDVVLDDGSSIYFTAKTSEATSWTPEPGAEHLTLTGTFASGFKLTDTAGVVSEFAKVAASATTWQITSSGISGAKNSTTGIVSEAVTVDGKTLARPKRLVASQGSVANDTCAQTPSTRGCRVLEFVYATATTATATDFGDFSGQVKEIRLWATVPGASSATSKSVQTYLYDSTGRLRQAWNPQISPALKTEYAYDAAGRVTKLTPPGEQPWSFSYDNVGGSMAGDGMLTKATRPTLTPGTRATVNGNAVTSVVYDVPLSGDKAPFAMNASSVRKWGQLDTPTDATAVFPADSVPGSHHGGSLTKSSYARAVIHYLNTSGAQVNTIDEAGGIETTEFDQHGNTVRTLSAGNHALALGATDADKARLADLGIASLSVSERAALLSTTSRYNAAGTRLLEEFEPLRRIELAEEFKDGTTVLIPAGTSVAAQPWTVNEYDEGRPTDGSATVRDQLTLAVVGTRVRGYYSVMAEKRVTATQYDWSKGLPKLTIEDAGGFDLTTTTHYDDQGRVTSHVPPGASGRDAATRITEYWKATGTGWCEGRPEWVGLECWTGPAGAITGGGSQPSEVVDTTTEYGFYGQVTEKADTANGATRITTIVYDDAGRVKSTQTDSATGKQVKGTSFTYDAGTGGVGTLASEDGGTIKQEYDTLGRVISYTDADGGVTRTEYDNFDRPLKVSDSVPSTVTYTYDHSAEPRGLATAMNDSVAGTFKAEYDVDGDLVKEELPGGYTMTQTVGKPGLPVQRLYTRDSDQAIVMSDVATLTSHGQWASRSGGAGAGEEQAYRYDAVGRLTHVDDRYNGACTTRDYAFDKRTNRTSLTTAQGAPGADCPTTGGTTVTSAFDSADRIVDSGYEYDAFGRTTSMPGGTSLDYYTTDLAYRQTTGDMRQTWSLDASGRFRGTVKETNTSGTWTRTEASVNHYGSSTDSPRWISDTATGSVSRMVTSLTDGLTATTGSSDSVLLQLSNLHGDISLILPLDDAVAPTALSTDEYGNHRGGDSGRYGWLGSYQRSAETPTNTILMGVRLYNPSTGRFLSVDPVYGGNRNAYEYSHADPVNRHDLDGRWSKTKTKYYNWGRLYTKIWTSRTWYGATKYHGKVEMRFNRSYTAKLGRSAHWYWGPFWAAVGLLGPVGAGFAVVGAAWSGFFQKAAAKANSKKRCITLGGGVTVLHGFPGGGPYYYTRRC
ncbi:RHS repeat-associated core domain-containing protein [Streptomyces viridosporus]|uniref:RHS repeat-associated core domain-containing protein n=1 Tax=Streptomyces viridosporus TaxID=67581 RepID=UPI00370365A9